MTEDNVLHNIIETVLFNEEQLNQLKQLINDLHDGRLTPKEVRTYIIRQKNHNVEKILELFPYYIRQMKMNDSLNQFTGDSLNDKTREELQEKNKFLEHIALRVNDNLGEFLGVIKAVTNVEQIYNP